MIRRRFSFIALSGLAVLCAIGFHSEVHGGKKTPPPPPPPPPADPFLIYELRPDLGGVLDKNTNLVWGYNFYDIVATSAHSGYGINQQFATGYAANYAALLYDQAVGDLPDAAAETEAFADWQTEQGDIALASGDVDLANRWYAAANTHYENAQADRDSIPLYLDAAATASQFEWRLPTQQEATTAINNGLFTYGQGGFNGYDGSPYVGGQVPWNSFCWSSTFSKSKREAWAYCPLDGSNGLITVTSQVNCVFVRKHVPQ